MPPACLAILSFFLLIAAVCRFLVWFLFPFLRERLARQWRWVKNQAVLWHHLYLLNLFDLLNLFNLFRAVFFVFFL